uniref:DUF1618 domain-containing protein n=1 Tax=Oryza glumipatula TaxID=40148 RepID=A0A0D9Y2J4_9ORYZ
MAGHPRPPPLVLLERVVRFVEAAGLTSGGASRDPDVAAIIEVGGWSWSTVQMMGSVEEMERLMAPSVKPVAFLGDPPQVSSLHMLLPPPARLDLLGIGEISSTHKGIVVIYANKCYLLYDASNNHLTAIPPIPDSVTSAPIFLPLGRGAVLVSAAGADDDDYIFADIVTSPSTRGINPALPKATIFARVKNGGEWIQSSIPRLPLPPHLCGPTYFFHIDTAFSFAGTIFWVDLLKGILICDDILSSPQGPRLAFVPLPHCIDAHDKPRHCFSPNEHRSIGRVSGAIKFLALIGYCEASCPENEVKLKTWSLSPDFKHWKEETTLTVGDIWASESFSQMGLPHVLPFSPVLSVNEDGIMYAVLNDVKKEPIPQLNEFGDSLGMQLVPKANYMIRFDMLQNKVLSSTKISKKATSRWLTNTFLATDFSAYLQDRQNAEAAGKVGASAKGKRKRMSSRQAGRSMCQGQACDCKTNRRKKYIMSGFGNGDDPTSAARRKSATLSRAEEEVAGAASIDVGSVAGVRHRFGSGRRVRCTATRWQGVGCVTVGVMELEPRGR